jgi:hypothetical protein
MEDPAIVQTLSFQKKKSAFDQFLTLDFKGIKGHWFSLVQARLNTAVSAFWAHLLGPELKISFDALSRSNQLRFEPLRSGLRKLRGELRAGRERELVLEVKAEEERKAQQSSLQQQRERLLEILEQLSA